MSYDEARSAFVTDASATTATNNYLLVGDNAYGYSSGSTNLSLGIIGDLDTYFMRLSIGTSYSVIATDTSIVTPYVTDVDFALLDRYGNVLTLSTDYGSYSGFTFNALDTIYYVQAYTGSLGFYSLRLATPITEYNGIGEAISEGSTYSAAIDYVSDVDIYNFLGVAGTTYAIQITTTVSDLFFDIEYFEMSVTNLVANGSGLYTFTAPSTGNYSLHLSSNSYVQTGTYSFSAYTVDTTAPTVSTFSPTDGATSVAVASNVVLTFSEAIARGTGSIVLRSGSATGTVVETFDAATSTRLSLSGSTLTIDPTSNLSGNTQYFVTFASGSIKDLAGNNYAGTTTYDFRTDSILSLFPGASAAWNGASGNSYGLYKVAKTWNDAQVSAEGLGGYLVKVNSAAENTELFSVLSSQLSLADLDNTWAADGGGSAYVWLGASDSVTEGSWKWIADGTTLSTTRAEWGEGTRGTEPDNYNNQDYLALGMENWPYGSSTGSGYGDAGEWNDLRGTNLLYYVVEIGAFL